MAAAFLLLRLGKLDTGLLGAITFERLNQFFFRRFAPSGPPPPQPSETEDIVNGTKLCTFALLP
jgi:hypothetical protein